MRLDGSAFSLAELRGQRAWIEVWAPWDPASRQRLQDLEDLVHRHPDWPRRARLLAVAVAVGGGHLEVEEALPRGRDFSWEVVLDRGPVAEALGVNLVPTSLWLEPDGSVHPVREGYVEPGFLERELKARLDGPPTSPRPGS